MKRNTVDNYPHTASHWHNVNNTPEMAAPTPTISLSPLLIIRCNRPQPAGLNKPIVARMTQHRLQQHTDHACSHGGAGEHRWWQWWPHMLMHWLLLSGWKGGEMLLEPGGVPLSHPPSPHYRRTISVSTVNRYNPTQQHVNTVARSIPCDTTITFSGKQSEKHSENRQISNNIVTFD